MNFKKDTIFCCKDCGNKISYVGAFGGGRCIKCNNKLTIRKRLKLRRSYKGERNPNYGKRYKRNPQQIAELKARRGKNTGGFIDGRSLKKYYCIDCSCEIAWRVALHGKHRCKICSSKHKVKSYFPRGRIGTNCADYYKNIWMKSTWEIRFAYWLDLSEVEWKYEPVIFYLGDITYTPDFYLPEFDCYIEIKGWWRGKAKMKIKKFKEKYPNENLHIFQKPELINMGIL